MLVWFFGVMLLGGIANFVGFLFKFIGYETGYSNLETDNAILNAGNASAMAAIKGLMVEDMAMETSVALSLYMQMENWHWAAWEALPQEDKETQLEELMAEIEEWDAEKMAEMEAEMKEEKSEDADEDEDEDAEEEVAEEEDAEEEE
jgi:hypothetical protein